MTITLKQLSLALASTGLLTIYGCGGGGGESVPPATPTMLSGTAAGGAAIIGTVTVTDSKGASKGATIEADGHYSIDVSGMTGPFILKAAGTVGTTSVTYYSAATEADQGGTVNVTPFTNLMVSNIAAQMAETYFSNPTNIATIGTLITPEKLAAAETALQTKLQPVLTALGIDASIDLLRSTFAADHSGMDAVLDMVKVEADMETNVVTLKNALTNVAIATDNVQVSTDDATAVDSTKISEITPTAVTDLQAVVTKLNQFSELFATSLPSVQTLQNSGVFDTSSNFMMGGRSFYEFATELSTQPSAIGLKFSNIAISLDASGTAGTLTALITSNTSTFKEQIQLQIAKAATGEWLVQGDGRIADLSLNAQAQIDEWISLSTGQTGTTMRNGIKAFIDIQSYNSAHASASIASAIITGPGLTPSGVTMVPDTQNTWMRPQGLPDGNNLIPECETANASQCVTIASALDNSEYTVVLLDANGASLNGAGYKLTLPKQPYATSTLTAEMFPSITSITIDGQDLNPNMMMEGKTVAIGWTMPAALQAQEVAVWASTSAGASYFFAEKQLLPTATSALLSLGTPLSAGTVSSAGMWLSGIDGFGREMGVTKTAL